MGNSVRGRRMLDVIAGVIHRGLTPIVALAIVSTVLADPRSNDELLAAAKRSDPAAEYELARRVYAGEGFERDAKQACHRNPPH